MAEYLTNDADLKKVADAIRTKGGTSAALKYPDGFTSAIGAIKTTPILQAKTVTPAREQQEVSPDSDYDGLSKVTVEAMPTGELGPVQVENHQNLISWASTGGYIEQGTIVRTPISDVMTVQGYERVIPGTSDQNIAENTYAPDGLVVAGDANLTAENIKKDVSIFGVTGTHEGSSLETVQLSVLSASGVHSPMVGYSDAATNDFVKKTFEEISGTVITIPKNSPVVVYSTDLNNPYRSSVIFNKEPFAPIILYRDKQDTTSGMEIYTFSQDGTLTLTQMCLIAGTLITLSDGSTKKVEDITYDDELLVWDFFNGCFTSAKPRWIKVKQTSPVYNKLTFSSGATLGLVGEGGSQGYHRIYNKQAGLFTHTGVPETPIGTITFAQDETEPVLIKQELVNEDVDYYNIITDKHFNLFANGILTSCKCSNMYRIENMKYVGERLMSDEEIEKDFEWREPLKALER